MKITIDQNKRKPAYLQLYEALRKMIVDGELRGGNRLPSKRQMAADTGVSVITVQHAYDLLTDEGYILARPRSGYFVDFGADLRATGHSGTLPPVPLPAAQSTQTGEFPFSVLAKTMRRVLAEYGERILVKSPATGCAELKTAIAEYLIRSRGVYVLPEQIVVGSGAEYLYGLVVQLLGRGRSFGLEAPGYEKIRQVYEANGARCRALALGQDGILTEELERSDAAVLHVTPYNSFPSGVTATAAKRHEYAAWAVQRGGYIVEDDYDSEFASPTKQIDTVFSIAPERVIYMNSFTRTMASSIRIGYMVLPDALLKQYRKELGFYTCTVPVFEQYVLAEIIRNGDLERCINRRRRQQRHEGLK